MKALSLWQPWAQAVVRGSKRIETRSWPTSYRGQLLIHAAKRCPRWEILALGSDWTWCGVLGWRMAKAAPFQLPFGAIIGSVNLVDCRPTGSFTVAELDTRRNGAKDDPYSYTERQIGDFKPGRFGWVLEDPHELRQPIPCRGWQRIWNLDPATLDPDLVPLGGLDQ